MMDKLDIKHKSVTNKWGLIKKKLWGQEVARAAGEKTRMAGSAAFLKRKHEMEAEEEARNPPPLPKPKPKPVKEVTRWYVDVPPVVVEAPATTEGGTLVRSLQVEGAQVEGGSTETRGGEGTRSASVVEGSASVGEGGASVGAENDETTNDGYESC